MCVGVCAFVNKPKQLNEIKLIQAFKRKLN